jgi:uncharacterized DUF497 family protein
VELEWDDANLEHIALHGIQPEEVEEAFADSRRKSADAYSVPGERRAAILGRTDDGRLLYVVFTRRSGHIRTVTARDATDRERWRCERR